MFVYVQERIASWNEQNSRYNSDLKKFRHQAVDLLEKLSKDYEKFREDLEGAGVRVDRVEKEMDFIETKNPPKPCVKAADKMVEQKPVLTDRKKKDEFYEVSGEPMDMWRSSFDHVPLLADGFRWCLGMWMLNIFSYSLNVALLLAEFSAQDV